LWGSQSSIAPKLRERQQLKIMDGIAAGIAFLHKNGICHRDLKSPNVPILPNLFMALRERDFDHREDWPLGLLAHAYAVWCRFCTTGISP
jgi:serine/threonine protein kinase